ncbi:CHAD domain-containing protein [Raineyella antarctica]|uniref:CHAD domain-containing protein n=1 Tax=Raineyella antarctica TaxID=1577474 RepID=A0A1G6GT90_9ACTN|nr:CYTH and CHAD domain-containing protein [Raineyella antarctica]SDB85240.1 CHAD domain-containing protein [Raineyella antarctica]
MPESSASASPGPHQQTETERKFALLPGAEVPDLSGLAAVGEPVVLDLSATYIDSPTYELNRARITLRRRTGGTDAAWHLKLPAEDGARTELHVPLEPTDDPMLVPRGLRSVVNERVGTVALVPVALLETRRTVRVLSDAATGKRLAELADDTVTATRLALPGTAGRSTTWRELEVELLEGDVAFLDAVTEKLQWAGIVPSQSPSKVSQALGDAPAAAAARQPSTQDELVETVLRALATHVGVLQGREEAVAVDAPDAVHKARVASRRLRSILRVFRDLFDADAVQDLRDELQWYATELGHARDAEVQKARLLDQLDSLPSESVVGPVRARMETELEATHQAALAGVAACLADDRYRALMISLGRWLSDPPLAPDAGGTVAERAVELVDKAITKVRRAHAEAEASQGEEQLAALHEVRKKAKIVRYACEALVPAYGESAASSARDWEAVTEVFGEMNDAVVARARLLALAEAATAADEPTFTYGVLFGTQMGNLDRDLPEARAALKRAVRHGPDSWGD